MFIARPLVVLICTLFDKNANWSFKDRLFMMWVRETGVIPAALSGIIVSMKVPGYEIISSLIFFINNFYNFLLIPSICVYYKNFILNKIIA